MPQVNTTCPVCLKQFYLIPCHVGHRKYCSNKCYGFSKRGYIPWNKGKTGIYSDEHLQKMSIIAKQLNLRPPSQQGVKQSKETIRKRILRGEKHWNWQGGITDELRKRVNATYWRKLRLRILKRDNYTCQMCGYHSLVNLRRLNIHHIVPYRISQDDNPNNLETLCLSCHAKADSKYRKIYNVQVR